MHFDFTNQIGRKKIHPKYGVLMEDIIIKVVLVKTSASTVPTLQDVD